jgi:hypothetical protein
MKISATRPKASCLKLIDRVAASGAPIILRSEARWSRVSYPVLGRGPVSAGGWVTREGPLGEGTRSLVLTSNIALAVGLSILIWRLIQREKASGNTATRRISRAVLIRLPSRF